MIAKRDKLGGIYHEPPYTRAEEADLYRRSGDATSLTRLSSSRKPQPPASPPGAAPCPPSA